MDDTSQLPELVQLRLKGRTSEASWSLYRSAMRQWVAAKCALTAANQALVEEQRRTTSEPPTPQSSRVMLARSRKRGVGGGGFGNIPRKGPQQCCLPPAPGSQELDDILATLMCTQVSQDRKCEALRVHWSPAAKRKTQFQQPFQEHGATGHLVSGLLVLVLVVIMSTAFGGRSNLVPCVRATLWQAAVHNALPGLSSCTNSSRNNSRHSILDVPNAQPTPSQRHPEQLASQHHPQQWPLWTDPETMNRRDGGNEDMGSALEDEDFGRVLEGIASGQDLGREGGIKRHALGERERGFAARNETEATSPAQSSKKEQWVGWSVNITEEGPMKKQPPGAWKTDLPKDRSPGCARKVGKRASCLRSSGHRTTASGWPTSRRRAARAARESWLERGCGTLCQRRLAALATRASNCARDVCSSSITAALFKTGHSFSRSTCTQGRPHPENWQILGTMGQWPTSHSMHSITGGDSPGSHATGGTRHDAWSWPTLAKPTLAGPLTDFGQLWA